jgi:hypothetical protein
MSDRADSKLRLQNPASAFGMGLMTVAGFIAFIVVLADDWGRPFFLPPALDVWAVWGYFLLAAMIELSPWAPPLDRVGGNVPLALRLAFAASALSMLIAYAGGGFSWTVLLPWFVAVVARIVLALLGVTIWKQKE